MKLCIKRKVFKSSFSDTVWTIDCLHQDTEENVSVNQNTVRNLGEIIKHERYFPQSD